ncbi:MAG: amidohydrolase family protein [Acidobacteriota bacterium]|nr:amidohydrolase family protein [Acidobacteriota bacterium]
MKITRFKVVAFALLLLLLVTAGWLWLEITHLPDGLRPQARESAGVLLDNVRLASMVPGAPEVEEGRSVLVQGDRIAEVGAAGAVEAPEGVRRIDGAGRTLIPGLIDAHIHLSDEAELAAYLAHGVTGVRNMSGYPFHLRLPQRMEAGELLGPDFITTGPILNSHGPNENVLQQIVTTADEARAAVRAQHEAGYRTVKVYSNLTGEAFEAILAEAEALGMSVTGHSPEGVRTAGVPWEKPFDVPWTASVGRDFTTLEHVETVVWHSLRDDLDEEKMRAVADRLRASGDVVTPTLIAHRRLVLIAQSQGAYLERPGSETINPLVRLFEQGAEEYWSSAEVSEYEAPHAEFFLKATGLLHEAGVPLIAGTDAGGFGIIPGASLARELELLVAAGLSPHDALATATRVSAQALGFERTGQIAPGYRANLVLLEEDPLQRIGAVESPAAVMIRGEWLDEARLESLRQAARDTSLVRSAWRALEMKGAM